MTLRPATNQPSLAIFFSLVVPLRNQASHIAPLLIEMSALLSTLVSDHEIIVVDNASDDGSLDVLKALTNIDGLPNLQVYALTKEVDADTTAWVGLENALGDFVGVMAPLSDDIGVLPAMLKKAVSGADVVFAANQHKPTQNFVYRCSYRVFNLLYAYFGGINLTKDAPYYRVLSKSVINFILQHPQPTMTYRLLPATGGFTKAHISYSAPPRLAQKKNLSESMDRGIRLLVSTTRAPMRLVTSLSLFGAAANLLYSVYVLIIAFVKVDVAVGWVSLSLQQSGMFFLISLVLLVLGEYILNMVNLQNEGPLYHVAQEFTSARISRREKLNIEVVTQSAINRIA